MSNKSDEKHVLSMLVENQPGVLSRVSGLFSGRGFNIESLCVAVTEDQTVSRITLVTKGRSDVVEQIVKQLNKLINVIKVADLTPGSSIQQELALVRVRAKPEHRGDILKTAEMFQAKIVDVTPEFYTLEVAGDEEEIEAFLGLLRPMQIREMARTGSVALGRHKK